MWIPAEATGVLCCLVPISCIIIGFIFGNARWEDRYSTKRYPKYGNSPQMRIKGKSRINVAKGDKET